MKILPIGGIWLLIVALYLIVFGGFIHAQTVDPPPPAWVPIASEGTYQGSSPIVTLPASTVYTFGLTSGVLCDAMTTTATQKIVVWVSTFQATCMVGGKPPASGDGDPDPNQVKTLYVQQTTAAQSGTYTVPPSTTPISWSVPASGTTPPVIPPVIPPTTYTEFSCVGPPVIVTIDGASVTVPSPPIYIFAKTSASAVGYVCTVVSQ